MQSSLQFPCCRFILFVVGAVLSGVVVLSFPDVFIAWMPMYRRPTDGKIALKKDRVTRDVKGWYQTKVEKLSSEAVNYTNDGGGFMIEVDGMSSSLGEICKNGIKKVKGMVRGKGRTPDCIIFSGVGYWEANTVDAETLRRQDVTYSLMVQKLLGDEYRPQDSADPAPIVAIPRFFSLHEKCLLTRLQTLRSFYPRTPIIWDPLPPHPKCAPHHIEVAYKWLTAWHSAFAHDVASLGIAILPPQPDPKTRFGAIRAISSLPPPLKIYPRPPRVPKECSGSFRTAFLLKTQPLSYGEMAFLSEMREKAAEGVKAEGCETGTQSA